MLREYFWSIGIQKRKIKLEHALTEYSLYDPPHRIEERLLTKEKAAENFDYFMSVRHKRLAYFRDWLVRHFAVSVTLDEQGMRSLCRWGNEYAGFLPDKGADGNPSMSYFVYEPIWTAEYAGLNVVFDIGISLGEAIIKNCPKLHWAFDPFSEVLPNETKLLKRTPGMSFRRPLIVGFDNSVAREIPLDGAYMFAVSMMRNATTVEGVRSFREMHRFDRCLINEQLLNVFTAALNDYPEGDPAGVRRELGSDAYLKALESDAANTLQEDVSDERQ